MGQTIESKKKRLSSKPSTRFSTSVTTPRLRSFGRHVISNTALISRLVAMACSVSSRAFRRRLDMKQERLWPKGTLSSCTGAFRVSACR